MKTHAMAAALLLSPLAACASPQASSETARSESSGPLLLVGNKGEDTVSFIDLTLGEELARVATSANAPHEIAPSPDCTQAAVVNYGDRLIDVFDVASRTIVRTIDLGEHTRPHGIVWLDDGRIVASTEGNESIVEIAPDGSVTGIKTHEVGTHMVVVSPDGTRAYTTNLGAGTVSLLDLKTDALIKTVPAGAGTEGIDLTPDGAELWVSNRSANTVIVYDAQTLEQLATLEVGQFPLRLIISPDGTTAVTSNLVDGTLTLINVDDRSIQQTIPVSGDAGSAQVTILFSNDGERIYVAETGTNTVAEVSLASGEVERRFDVGTQGDGLALIGE